MVRITVVVKKRYKQGVIASTPAIITFSLIFGLVVSYVIMWALVGIDPASFYGTFLQTAASFTGIMEPSIFLTLLGTAVSIAFYGSFWNVGAEGQYVLGMVGAIYVVMFSPLSTALLQGSAHAPGLLKAVAMLLGGLLGAAWAAIPGVLRAYVGVSEVPVMLLMNYVAYALSDYLTAYHWRGRYTYGYIRTDMIPEPSRLTVVPGLEVLRYEALAVLALTLAATYFMLEWTAIGLRVKVLGTNPLALRSAGFDDRKLVVVVAAVSGFVAGLAGAVRLLGYDYRLPYNMADGKTGFYGYTAILVAWLSFRDIRLVVPAALIVALLSSFGYRMQMSLKGLLPPGVSAYAFSQVFIGTTLVAYTVVRVLRDYSVSLVITR